MLNREKRCSECLQLQDKELPELIRQKLNEWVFGVETQSGESLKVVDSSDFDEIVTEIVGKLKELQ